MDPLPLLVRPSTGRQPVRATILVATRITKKAPQVAAEAVRTGRCRSAALRRAAPALPYIGRQKSYSPKRCLNCCMASARWLMLFFSSGFSSALLQLCSSTQNSGS